MNDRRTNPVGTGSAEALAAAERALWRMMSFYGVPLDDLDAASAADPQWLLPPLMKAGWWLGLTEPGLVADAAALLDGAAALLPRAPRRERAHHAALVHLLAGRSHAACAVWDELLLAHPRDALALQWAHLWDFYRGDAANLRGRPARALPAWDDADPLHPQVLGLYAFGLEECHRYGAAEEAGRRALAADPRAPWAIHAVAHAMEMQGRFDDGAAWLRQQQPHWTEGNGFAVHLWWHHGLFRLEALDTAGALRLADGRLAGDALQVTLNRVDAASLLWRLHLLGVPLEARWQALLADWPLPDADAGFSAFNDVHVMLALLGAGDLQRAEGWLARCAEAALSAADPRRADPAVARETGLPLMRALLAFSRGEPGAARALYAVREGAQRLGGSHAQRDLIELTLLAAAAAAPDGRAVGRAVLHERLLAKPATPLTRHWAARLGVPEAALRAAGAGGR